MKKISALLYKDLCQMKKTIRLYIIFLVIWGTTMILMESLETILTVHIMFNIIMAHTPLTLDEQSKWYRFSIASPTGRRSTVQARYLYSLIINIVITLFLALLGIAAFLFVPSSVSNIMEYFILLFFYFSSMFFYFALIIPITFRFGADRIYIIIAMGIIIVLGIFVGGWLSKYFNIISLNASLFVPLLCFFLAACFCLIISYFISLSIMQKKEF